MQLFIIINKQLIIPFPWIVSSTEGGGEGERANLRSYLPSFPIRYELVPPASQATRTQPSSPTSPITRPSPPGTPS